MKVYEGKACDAILRHLERRQCAARANLRWPEIEGHTAPVELVCDIGQQRFAIEHTSIEPFPGLIQLNNQGKLLFDPISEAIAAVVPADEIYELVIPLHAMQGLRGRDLRQAQNALVNWIKETAPTLTKRLYADYHKPPAPQQVGHVPFLVQLYRFENLARGFNRLEIKHLLTGDLDALREDRIRKACNDKFGKLMWWKNDGARSVLLLENPDIQLTNAALVAETFLSIARGRPERPDETYLIDTYPTGPWYLLPLLVGNETYFDLGQKKHPLAEEVDPSILVPVTMR